MQIRKTGCNRRRGITTHTMVHCTKLWCSYGAPFQATVHRTKLRCSYGAPYQGTVHRTKLRYTLVHYCRPAPRPAHGQNSHLLTLNPVTSVLYHGKPSQRPPSTATWVTDRWSIMGTRHGPGGTHGPGGWGAPGWPLPYPTI